MGSQTLTIPGKLPSLNEVIAANRTHIHVGAKLKRDTEERIDVAIRQAQLLPFAGPVAVYIRWYERTMKRDADNIFAGGMKYILDALVGERVIYDDGPRYVTSIANTRYLDRHNPRVEVTLEEWSLDEGVWQD